MFLLDNLLETHAKMLENMQISAQVRENLQHPVVDVQEVLIPMLRFDQYNAVKYAIYRKRHFIR